MLPLSDRLRFPPTVVALFPNPLGFDGVPEGGLAAALRRGLPLAPAKERERRRPPRPSTPEPSAPLAFWAPAWRISCSCWVHARAGDAKFEQMAKTGTCYDAQT